jgi:hypothetical protein
MHRVRRPGSGRQSVLRRPERAPDENGSTKRLSRSFYPDFLPDLVLENSLAGDAAMHDHEHIYARIAAAIFAMQHVFLPEEEFPTARRVRRLGRLHRLHVLHHHGLG